MSWLAHLDPGDEWLRMATGVLLQATAVILLAATIARTTLRRRAAPRHGLWLITLVWVLCSPAVAVLADRTGMTVGVMALPSFGPPPVVEVGPAPVPRVASRPFAREPVAARPVESAIPEANVVASPEVVPRGRVLAGGTIALWALGTLGGLVRIAFGWWRLSALSRAARPIDAAKYRTALAEARTALGVAALPPVEISRRAAGPLAIGLLRSRIVLPERLAGGLTGPALRDVLVHEGAHILRHDPWVGLLQRLAGALFWPYPLIHYLNWQLARAHEEVCDNYVLGCGDAVGYARTLLALTERCRPWGEGRVGLGLFGIGSRWTLANRITGLLEPGRDRMTRTSKGMKLAHAVAIVVLGFLVASIRMGGPSHADEPQAKGAEPVAAAAPAEEGGHVVGTVVDERGAPVAGAVVRPLQLLVHPRTRTAADGSFRLDLDGPFAGSGGFMAEAEDGARMGLVRYDQVRQVRVVGPVRIVVRPSRQITVRIKDTAGRPVAGASVDAIELLKYQIDGRTDAEGVARLRLPADAKIQSVVGHKSGIGCDFFANERPRPTLDYPPLPDELTLTLDGADPVRIKAIDSKVERAGRSRVPFSAPLISQNRVRVLAPSFLISRP